MILIHKRSVAELFLSEYWAVTLHYVTSFGIKGIYKAMRKLSTRVLCCTWNYWTRTKNPFRNQCSVCCDSQIVMLKPVLRRSMSIFKAVLRKGSHCSWWRGRASSSKQPETRSDCAQGQLVGGSAWTAKGTRWNKAGCWLEKVLEMPTQLLRACLLHVHILRIRWWFIVLCVQCRQVRNELFHPQPFRPEVIAVCHKYRN